MELKSSTERRQIRRRGCCPRFRSTFVDLGSAELFRKALAGMGGVKLLNRKGSRMVSRNRERFEDMARTLTTVLITPDVVNRFQQRDTSGATLSIRGFGSASS